MLTYDNNDGANVMLLLIERRHVLVADLARFC